MTNSAQNLLADIYLSSGTYSEDIKYCWGPGMRDVYCLFYVCSGQGKIYVEDKVIDVYAKDLFLFFPYSSVRIESDNQNPWKLKWLEFKGLEASMLISQTSFTKDMPVIRQFQIENIESVFNIPTNVNQYLYLKCRQNTYVYYIISLLLEFAPKVTTESHDYAYIARNYIEKYYSRPDCTVQQVSDYVKIDRTYLFRLFKKDTGMSVLDYINKCRIDKAVIMLLDTHISIKDVAHSVGFSDQMYFSKVFKKIKGTTPTQYRQLHQNEV